MTDYLMCSSIWFYFQQMLHQQGDGHQQSAGVQIYVPHHLGPNQKEQKIIILLELSPKNMYIAPN